MAGLRPVRDLLAVLLEVLDSEIERPGAAGPVLAHSLHANAAPVRARRLHMNPRRLRGGRRALILMLGALIGLAACSAAGPLDGDRRRAAGHVVPLASDPAGPGTSVPIQFINNKFLVSVVLNDNYPATLLLDTGANHTIISPEMARRAGLDAAMLPGRAKLRMANGVEIETSVVRLQSISVGAARIANFGVAVFAFAVPGLDGQRLAVDGFLGVDFLARFIVTIDPRAGRLTLQLPAAR